MEINEKIRNLRKETGLSQRKFAEHFGIPVRTLQQWEQGQSKPPRYITRMIAYILFLEGKNVGDMYKNLMTEEKNN